MGEIIRRALSFGEGANTSESGITAAPAWRSFDEANVSGGGNQRRFGKVKLYQFPVTATVVDFDVTNDRIDLPSVAALTVLGTRFSVECLFNTDTLSALRAVLGDFSGTGAPIKIVHATSGVVTVTFRDSSGNTTQLSSAAVAAGTDVRLLATRNGAALSLYVNNAAAVTGTMNATNPMATGRMSLGTVNGSNWYDGRIDYLRFLNTVETSNRNALLRLPNPRADNVIADYLVTLDSNGYCLDRGPGEYHGESQGSPASTGIPLCVNPDPVMGLGSNVDKSGKRQFYAVVGSRVYPYTLA